MKIKLNIGWKEWLFLAAFLFAVVLDFVMTLRGLEIPGTREVNPLANVLAHITGGFVVGLILIKIFAIGILYVFYRDLKNNVRVYFTTTSLITFVVLGLIVDIQNLTVNTPNQIFTNGKLLYIVISIIIATAWLIGTLLDKCDERDKKKTADRTSC